MGKKKAWSRYLRIIIIVLFLFLPFVIVQNTFADETVKLPEAQKAPAPEYDGTVETNLFGPIQDDGTGCGIYNILNLVINILTFGIGISAIIGITICGINYLTAKGNVNQTVKAKNRFVQIIIGLAFYATLWALLSWLLPGGDLNTSKTCKTTTSTRTTTGVDTWKNNYPNLQTKIEDPANLYKNANSTSASGTANAGKKLLDAAVNTAVKFGKHHVHYDNGRASNSWSTTLSRQSANCATYVSLSMQDAGLIKKNTGFYIIEGDINKSSRRAIKKNKKLKVTYGNNTVAKLVKAKKLVPGDVTGPTTRHHTMIYAGKKKNKYCFYSVNGPYGQKLNRESVINKGFCPSSGYRLGVIIHPR